MARTRKGHQLLTRRHSNVVACALANKQARIVWAVLAKSERLNVQIYHRLLRRH
jgi:hypothetical protein